MGSHRRGRDMRFQALVAAIILSACGGAPDSGVATNPDSIERSELGPDIEVQTSTAKHSPNCDRDRTLSEVLERVGQNAHVMPDPWAEHQSALRRERFGKLLDFVGNCYRATPTGDSAEQTADIQFWSTALGGAAITIEHALVDGSYGGISYIYPGAEPDAFTYVYITNAGFHTQGTIIINDDQSFTASETVNGHPTITEVRSISRFDETGLTSMTSEFLDQGEWQPGPAFTHEVTTEPFPRLHMPIPASPPISDE